MSAPLESSFAKLSLQNRHYLQAFRNKLPQGPEDWTGNYPTSNEDVSSAIRAITLPDSREKVKQELDAGWLSLINYYISCRTTRKEIEQLHCIVLLSLCRMAIAAADDSESTTTMVHGALREYFAGKGLSTIQNKLASPPKCIKMLDILEETFGPRAYELVLRHQGLLTCTNYVSWKAIDYVRIGLEPCKLENSLKAERLMIVNIVCRLLEGAVSEEESEEIKRFLPIENMKNYKLNIRRAGTPGGEGWMAALLELDYVDFDKYMPFNADME